MEENKQSPTMKERFLGTIILAAVGDAIGYKNGHWEFCTDTKRIYKDLETIGGVSKIDVDGWLVSDDTIMHVATLLALIKSYKNMDELMTIMAKEYIACWKLMGGRAPGGTCAGGVRHLKEHKWNTLPFDEFGGGCGGSMRAMGIGLRFYGKENREALVGVGIESGRLTHNHPIGFLGAMVSGAFTALAIEGIPPKKWGQILMNELMPIAEKYLLQVGRDVQNNREGIEKFKEQWNTYLLERDIAKGDGDPKFPKDWNTNIEARDNFYKKFSFRGWAGASGDDSVIIAYDALLSSNGDWDTLIKHSCLHAGDSDSTGTIACAWYGALYGLKGVHKLNYEKLEFREKLEDIGSKLYEIAQKKSEFEVYGQEIFVAKEEKKDE